MRTIAVGQNPQAAFVAGVNVKKTQYVAVMLGGLTCGMAGAYLSISYLSMFVRDMVSGRGFIAIAAILFGRYSPFGIFAAALFFGLADAMQIALQGIVTIPNEVIQCAPYLLTILAVTVNEAAPAAQRHQVRKEGTPYEDNDTRRALYALPEL